jgi:hypothetical protein
LSSGKLTKANINNRGYNKYLKLEGEVKIEIDKGYIYNYVIDLQIDVLY